jgi:hypothetical protein
MDLYFSDYYEVDPAVIDAYGAFDVSLVSDLPLFIDPFHLFNSDDEKFRELHERIVRYLKFLRDRAGEPLTKGAMETLYCFPEVEQNWFGFTQFGNGGHGLGPDFARHLHAAFRGILRDFGEETVTNGSHLEKVTLVGSGVGQDNISDFTTNLIKGFLCEYTQEFAREHISEDKCAEFYVDRAVFNYATESWASKAYVLPRLGDDFVLLTPLGLLTRGKTWINHADMIRQISRLPDAVSDPAQREKINRYLQRQLGPDPTRKKEREAAQATISVFPELIDLYIRLKEETGDRARTLSEEEVARTRLQFVAAVRDAISDLAGRTDFFDRSWTTYQECLARVAYFKNYVENQDGYRLFNRRGVTFSKEEDLQLVFGLVWGGTDLDVNREVNNGRGPVDFKASYGKGAKALIEFKLASNTSLKKNLQNQVAIYEAANGTRQSVKVIVCFTAQHQERVTNILRELGLENKESVVVIDARADNKPSASNA